MKNILLFLSLILPFLGPAQQIIEGSIIHDGMQRDYILYIPDNYSGNESVPLILNYHGYTSTAYEQMYYGDFRSIADTAGFLPVHPQGSLYLGITHWNVGGWTIGSTVDDVGFSDALIDSLLAEYNIDPLRVYATGMSNGGFMSFLLACQLSEKIAAIASVAGSMTPETYDPCNPVHPTPILQIHSIDDPLVPYSGASWTKPIDDALQYWVDYNNCFGLPTVTALPDIDPNDGSTVELIVYHDGDSGTNVEHYKITGGGHTWPGNAIGGPGTNYDIDASVEIWKFFMRYDLNGSVIPTGLETISENDFDIEVYPNPFSSFTTIRFQDLKENAVITLYNSVGESIVAYRFSGNEFILKRNALPAGLYFFQIADNGKFSTSGKLIVQ